MISDGEAKRGDSRDGNEVIQLERDYAYMAQVTFPSNQTVFDEDEAFSLREDKEEAFWYMNPK